MISSDVGEKLKASRLKRERLFRKSRPLLRAFDVDRDMWVLWAAYDLGSFPQLPAGLNPSKFTEMVRGTVKARSAALVMEDECRWFKAGRGPVCLILVDNHGWQIEPYVDFFKWATPRIKLRSAVAFFQKIRYDRAVGLCLVKTHEKFCNLFNSLTKYGVLRACGRIPQGYPNGDQYLYQVRGKHAGTDGAGRASEVQRDDRNPREASPGAERHSDHRPAAVLREPERQEAARPGQPPDSDHRQRESNPPPVTAPAGVDVELRTLRARDWA